MKEGRRKSSIVILTPLPKDLEPSEIPGLGYEKAAEADRSKGAKPVVSSV